MMPKNVDFWSRNFWLPEGVDWEHIQDYENEENLKAANVRDLFPVIYLTIGWDPRTDLAVDPFRSGPAENFVLWTPWKAFILQEYYLKSR